MTKIWARPLWGGAALAVLLSGCTTHLEVGRADLAKPDTRRGIAYFLPFTQFDVTVSWVVTKCDADGPSIAIKSAIKPATAPDPRHLYVIDYSSLDAWTKTSSVKAEFYDSGAIKSINASADDRTGEIATKLLSSVGKVAKFAFVGAGAVGSSQPACDPKIIQALADITTAKGDIERQSGELVQQNEILVALTARVVRSGDATAPALLDSLDKQVGAVAAKQIELAASKQRLERLMKSVTYSDTTLFPETSNVAASTKPVLLPIAKLREWLGNEDSLGDNPGQIEAALMLMQQDKSVWFELRTDAGSLTGSDSFETVKAERTAGLRYRVGLPGTLRICAKGACSDPVAPVEVIDNHKVTVLQQGSTFYLPFASAPFTNASLTATFSEAGVLTSAGYENKKAAGEVAAGVADALADQVVSVGTAVREARKSELDKVKEATELAKAQNELAVAQKALLESPDAGTDQETAALAADTALKMADLANIQADIALRKAREERGDGQ